MSERRTLQVGRFRLPLQRPLVMGIINVTADSFSDGGRYLAFDHALAHASRLIEEGADLIDLGGESTRPGAAPVGEAEELQRVVPLVEALRDAGVPISVDTRKPIVMRAALDAGADMINDVFALRETGAIEVLAQGGACVCLMHMRGDPLTMQNAPHYDNVVTEVREFLRERVARCLDQGISADRIVIDPGFGFGKTVAHNMTLLGKLRQIPFDQFPLLVGLSRKSTLATIVGKGELEPRTYASIAAALAAVERGASIVRVHDVAPTVDALKVWQAAKTAEEATVS